MKGIRGYPAPFPGPQECLTATIHDWAAGGAGKPLELKIFDVDALGAEEVEVAVDYCGVCHSDLSMINNEWGMSGYPFIPGHEIIGRVTAVGAQARGLSAGQRVGIGWTAGSCMHCQPCLSGDQNRCNELVATIGAVLEPIPVPAFTLIGRQRQVSGKPTGSPVDIARMRAFAARHDIRPQVEMFPMSKINEALKHLKEGKARYRIVLEGGR